MTGKETYGTRECFFRVVDGPGPFQILMGFGEMFQDRRKPMVLEFTLLPLGNGEVLLGHNRKFHILFEVAFLGPITKTVDSAFEPKCVQLLGRFYARQWENGEVSREKECNEWRWEIVFDPKDRKGTAYRLDQPLPTRWTL